MSGTTYVLLPPSESKTVGGHGHTTPGSFDEDLNAARRRVLEALDVALSSSTDDERSRLLKVKGPLLERALAATSLLLRGSPPVLPAWRRYDGVVWSHLDPATLSENELGHILIPSGLYGLTSALDEIADYRLTMKVTLPNVGAVGAFWRPFVRQALEGVSDATFVDLLPKEHAVLLRGPGAWDRVVSVQFRQHGGDGVAGHDAKAVKGVLARHVLRQGLECVDGFHWRGWRGRLRHGVYEVRAPRVRRETR